MIEKNKVISVRMSENIGWKHCYGEFYYNCETIDRNISVTKIPQQKMTENDKIPQQKMTENDKIPQQKITESLSEKNNPSFIRWVNSWSTFLCFISLFI